MSAVAVESVARSHPGGRMLSLLGEKPEATSSPCGGSGALGLCHAWPAVPEPFARPRMRWHFSEGGGARSHPLRYFCH